MNMKKTIAGVMAGAMAVSAMAATVSAVDAQSEITLVYDLKVSEWLGTSNSTATIRQQFKEDNKKPYVFDASNFVLGCSDVLWGSTEALQTLKAIKVEIAVNDAEGTQNKNRQTIAFTNDAAFAKANPGYVYNTAVFSGRKFTMPCSMTTATNAIYLPNFQLGGSDGLGYSEFGASDYGFNSLDVEFVYECNDSWYDYADLVSGNAAALTVDNSGIKNFAGEKALPIQFGITNVTKGEYSQIVFPMESNLKAPADVITWISGSKSGVYYTRPLAVINDAIANHTDVTFTFTSFDGRVDANARRNIGTTGDGLLSYATYMGAPAVAEGGTWYNPLFSQHLYGNVADRFSAWGQGDYDNFGSYSNAWGINLFTGAVVVNSDITMQLNDTDYFVWDTNTLSFNWFDITDGSKITDAKTFLKSMLLYTPVEWYWDNLVVSVAAEEAEDVTAGEGIDGEGDVIEDEEVVEEVVEVVEEVEEVEEVVEPETPVESPKTGNAPVALAVIPVALAAAAVVAKKRG
ncbi:MAG: hypothetical protein ACI4Q6_09330 [Huintestinicola sp.]